MEAGRKMHIPSICGAAAPWDPILMDCMYEEWSLRSRSGAQWPQGW